MVGVDQACKDHARQEGFARPGGAKNARGTLDEFVQFEADRMPLLASAAHTENLIIILFAEDFGDIGLVGEFHGRVMIWDGLTVSS